MTTVDYQSLKDALAGADEASQIAALKALLEIPAEGFDKSQLPALFKLLRSTLHSASSEVQYTARRTLDRLKGLTGLGDLALVLTEYLDDEDREAEPERPELVYGTTPYWLYELNSKDYRIRVKAVMELCQTRQKRIYETLSRHQDAEGHEWVHATYAKYLGNFPGQPGVYQRIARYLGSPDNRVRANCLEGLELLGDAQAVTAVRPLLEDSDNRVRANAAKFLVRFDLESVKKALDQMLSSSEEWMRDSATYILARVDFPGIVPFLERALADPNPSIAARAARALVRKGDADEARRALETVDRDRDPQLHRAVTEALASLDTPRG